MALGVAFTGIIAMAVALNPAITGGCLGPMKWVLFISVLGLGWFSGKIMFGGSPAMAQGAFWLYAAMWSALMAPMFYMYTGESIVRVFFITAAAFAGTAYTATRRRRTSQRWAASCRWRPSASWWRSW